MGKNKLAKFADLETYPHVFQMPSSQVREGVVFPLRGCWGRDFFHNDHPIVLELGCGKGEYTVGLARLFPGKNFIGVDIKGARIWTGAKQSLESGMANVAFLRTDIEMINHFFAADEVSEVWLTFPDPQMKKATKRLTSTNFMRLYQQMVKPGGLVHLKTDSNFLFTYTCEATSTTAASSIPSSASAPTTSSNGSRGASPSSTSSSSSTRAVPSPSRTWK